MTDLLLWWLAAEVLGLLALPFAATLFARLPDRGWALARPLGLLVWGWLIWFPLSLIPALPYTRPALVVILIVFAGLALWRARVVGGALAALVRREWRYLLASEAVFTGAFALMAWYRTFMPAVVDQEKYMDVAFLASYWRAPHLPAPDPWLAGYPINYYSFGHYLMGTLAKLLATPPDVAFNTAIILTYALTASAVFGLIANLVAAHRAVDAVPPRLGRAAGWGTAGVVLVLVLGNLAGARTWWQNAVTAAQQQPALLHGNPWAWWTHPQLWLTFDWWTPSRINPNVITEFPAFSFILSDLHAHVLALPFAAVAVALALNLLLARGAGLRVFGARWSGVLALWLAAVVIGSLFALNGWDLPTYLGLAILTLGIGQWIEHRGPTSTFWLNWFAASAMLAAFAVLAYIPFYRGFVSPAQGIGLVPPATRTLLGDEFAMFGLPAVLVGSLLVLRLVRALGVLSGTAHVAWNRPDGSLTRTFSASTGTTALIPAVLVGSCLALLTLGSLQTPRGTSWTLVWALALLVSCALVAWHTLGAATADAADPDDATAPDDAPVSTPHTAARADLFLWCAAGTAFALIAASEVVYLRDVFGGGDLFRMNTVFKLDYQAWLLLGTAAATALAALAPRAIGRLGDIILAVASGLDRLAPPAPAHLATTTNVDAPLALAATPVSSHRPTPAHAATADHIALPTLSSQSAQADFAAAGPPAANVFAGAPPAGALPLPPATDPSEPAQPGFVAEPLGAGSPARVPVTPLGPVALRWLGLGGTLLWAVAVLMLLGAAAIYPIQAAAARTNNFTGPHSLDGLAYLAADPLTTGDQAAIAWLNDPAHVSGDPVILEAVSANEGDYTHYARISANTGLPTVMGWVGHEWQWRVNWVNQPGHTNELQARPADVQTIYTSHDPGTVRALLAHYDVRYVYVGAMERDRYPGVNMDQFADFLRVVYRAAGVTIYEVR